MLELNETRFSGEPIERDRLIFSARDNVPFA